jgi:hypothetical protein
METQPGDEESKPDVSGERSNSEVSDNPQDQLPIGAESEVEKSAKNDAAKAEEEAKAHRAQAKIFNDLLEKTAPEIKSEGKTYRHPVIIDGLLALGLLVAMAGFTLGAVKIYIVHEARHDITERRYREAIVLLRSAPLPGLFQVNGESPEDLLDQAHYLDAIEKLDIDKGDQAALRELDAIRPGSRFFEMANNIKDEHAPLSQIKLEGAAEHQATAAEVKAAERPLPGESGSEP